MDVATFSIWSLIVVTLAIQDTLVVNGVSVQDRFKRWVFAKAVANTRRSLYVLLKTGLDNN